jgi:hypothetical protein
MGVPTRNAGTSSTPAKNKPIKADIRQKPPILERNLNESQVMMVLDELKAAVLFFNGMGSPVKLPGLGWFSPSIKRDGKYCINLRVDKELKKGINAEDAFYGEVINHTHIGLDNETYKSLWDEEHPDNPLEI